MTIPTNLIENALNLTGKTMDDMNIKIWQYHEGDIYKGWCFSIEKFCFYLLSPEFIEKYSRIINGEYYFDRQEKRMSKIFGEAIHEYQRKDKKFPEGNPEPLINLLEKIPTP